MPSLALLLAFSSLWMPPVQAARVQAVHKTADLSILSNVNTMEEIHEAQKEEQMKDKMGTEAEMEEQTDELAATKVHNFTSQSIWGGENVELVDSSNRQMKLGPYPPFVALVSWSSDGTKPTRCGGTLLRHGKSWFILTAGHCLGHSSNTLHAYLNPYRNPWVTEEALAGMDPQDGHSYLDLFLNNKVPPPADKKKFAKTWPDLSRFRVDRLKKGVGLSLPIKRPPSGAELNGLRHVKYGQDDLNGPVYDIALIPLDTSDLAASLKVDETLTESFEATLAEDLPSEMHHLVGSIYGVYAMAYGNGMAKPDDSTCGYGEVLTNCLLQQKRFEILPHDECMKRYVPMVTSKLLLTCALKDEALRKLFATDVGPGEASVDEQVTALRSACDDFLKASQTAQREIHNIEKLKEHMRNLDMDLTGFAKGRQICVMSKDQTGSVSRGDSGGPLVSEDGKLLGVASWSHYTEEGNLLPLFDRGFRVPSFYSSIPHFGTVIKAAMRCLAQKMENPVNGESLPLQCSEWSWRSPTKNAWG